MVRLKEVDEVVPVGLERYFNSTMVRLKAGPYWAGTIACNNFNSTMVRLKEFALYVQK